MASENKSTVVKVRPGNQDGSSKGKLIDSKQKSVSSSKQPVDSKLKSVTAVAKTEVKSKPTPGSSKPTSGSSKPTPGSSKTTSVSSKKTTTTTTTTTKKTATRVREKKVYTLPGQKSDPPEEREPLRIFYESLSKQIPTSEMAEFWMMEHGLLPLEKAKKAYEKKQRRQKELRMGTPIKSVKPPSKPESSQRQQQASKNGNLKAKKKILDESDDDDDFILSPKRRKFEFRLCQATPSGDCRMCIGPKCLIKQSVCLRYCVGKSKPDQGCKS